MSKNIKIISTTVLITSALAFFLIFPTLSKSSEPELLLRPIQAQPKNVEILIPATSSINLKINKSGTINSDQVVTVTPQVNGRITDIFVQTGDHITSNTLLAKLGDSLNSDITELQNQSAKKALTLTKNSYSLTEQSTKLQIQSAEVGVKAAQLGYQMALKSRRIAEDSFNLQLQSTYLDRENLINSIDVSEDSYDDFQDNIDDLKDASYDLKDEIRKLEKNIKNATPEEATALEPILKELKNQRTTLQNQIETLEQQEKQLELGLSTNYNNVEKTDLGIQLQHQNFYSQILQIDANIENANNQLILAKNQLASAKNAAKLQLTQLQGQIIQAEQNVETLKLTLEQNNIISPISGTITKIHTDQGNLIGPGQPLFEITNLEKLIVETFITPEEANFIDQNTTAEIIVNNQKYSGKIQSISPNVDPQHKKITVKIAISNTESQELTAGTTAQVSFIPDLRSRIFIPLNAVLIENSETKIRIVDQNNTVQLLPIQIGEIINEYVEITSNINPETKIITTVNLFLTENEKVTIQ